MKCQAVALLYALTAFSVAAPSDDAAESKRIARELSEIRRLSQARGIQPQAGTPADRIANAKGQTAVEIRRELEQMRRQFQAQPAPAGGLQRIGGGNLQTLAKPKTSKLSIPSLRK
jgi:hypothetical protein